MRSTLQQRGAVMAIERLRGKLDDTGASWCSRVYYPHTGVCAQKFDPRRMIRHVIRLTSSNKRGVCMLVRKSRTRLSHRLSTCWFGARRIDSYTVSQRYQRTLEASLQLSACGTLCDKYLHCGLTKSCNILQVRARLLRVAWVLNASRTKWSFLLSVLTATRFGILCVGRIWDRMVEISPYSTL